jgi:hypothetical protein
VVDRDSLENCCTLRGTEGSNPSLSAKESKSLDEAGILKLKGTQARLKFPLILKDPSVQRWQGFTFFCKDHSKRDHAIILIAQKTPACNAGRDLLSFARITPNGIMQ